MAAVNIKQYMPDNAGNITVTPADKIISPEGAPEPDFGFSEDGDVMAYLGNISEWGEGAQITIPICISSDNYVDVETNVIFTVVRENEGNDPSTVVKRNVTLPTCDKDGYTGDWSSDPAGSWWLGLDGAWDYSARGSWRITSDGRWWFGDDNNWYAKNRWLMINGYWYYFDKDGFMATYQWVDGFWVGGDGKWTYEGIGSWKKDGQGWTYSDTKGWKAVNTWQKINGVWCYFDNTGHWVEDK